MDDNLRRTIYKVKVLGKLLSYILLLFEFKSLSFYKDQNIVNLIKSIKNEVNFAFYPYEAFILYSIAKSQSRLDGEMAEVGVYQGGSAKLICEVKGKKKIHLFDTFTGLPPVSNMDTHFGAKVWMDNLCNDTSEEKVRTYLSKYESVFIHKGKFPDTTEPVKDSKFSFVHLDVDLYQSTIDCLKFFYPLLVKGGVILTHDYHSNGVQTAFSEYFQNKTIPIIELTGSQCMIVKTE